MHRLRNRATYWAAATPAPGYCNQFFGNPGVVEGLGDYRAVASPDNKPCTKLIEIVTGAVRTLLLVGMVAFWLITIIFLGAENLARFDAPTGKRFPCDRGPNPTLAEVLVKLDRVNVALKECPRSRRLAVARAQIDALFAGREVTATIIARRYVNRARAAGSPVQLQTWNHTVHVWHVFNPELPEAREALDEIGKFLVAAGAAAT